MMNTEYIINDAYPEVEYCINEYHKQYNTDILLEFEYNRYGTYQEDIFYLYNENGDFHFAINNSPNFKDINLSKLVNMIVNRLIDKKFINDNLTMIINSSKYYRYSNTFGQDLVLQFTNDKMGFEYGFCICSIRIKKNEKNK